MNKRKLSFVFLVMLSLVILVACGGEPTVTEGEDGDSTAEETADEEVEAQPEPASSGLKEIRIGYQVIPNAELLAKGLGLYEEKFAEIGVEVSWHQFQGAIEVNTAMTAGSIDVGLIGSSSVATGIAQDLPFQVIWLHDVIGDNEALVVKEDSGIKSLEDIVGKTIAVTFGSTTHYSLLSAMEMQGIDQGDLTILDMKPDDMLAAYLNDQIDGGYVWDPTLGKMIDEGGEVILSNRELVDDGIIAADVCVANKDFIQNHPEVVQVYIESMDEAVKFYRENEDEAAKIMAGELAVSEEEAKQFMKNLIWLDASEQASEEYLGTPDNVGKFAEALQNTGEFLVSQKAIPSAPELDVFEAGIQPQFVAEVAKK